MGFAKNKFQLGAVTAGIIIPKPKANQVACKVKDAEGNHMA